MNWDRIEQLLRAIYSFLEVGNKSDDGQMWKSQQKIRREVLQATKNGPGSLHV